MIEIVYKRKKHLVTMNGHAGSGQAGRDIVCAAATMLLYTLASNVTNLCDSKPRLYRRKHIRLTEGYGEVSCAPIRDAKTVGTLVFDTVCAGFELLSRQYPESLCVIV